MNNSKICMVCIMDTSDPEITFDDGVCNHCTRFEKIKSQRLNLGTNSETIFNKLIDDIKKKKGNSQYDCIIGVSGGVDSTYVASLLVKKGIKPLAVHFDNGWNSELAVSNIEKTIDVLGIDLHTHVINWNIFKKIQLAFLKSSTPDCEIPTDHAINAVLLDTAKKYNIKYIINGMNFATEGMAVPSWSYGHSDWVYIKDILKKNGVGVKYFKDYPHFSLIKLFQNIILKRVKIVSILNYINYNKENALVTIKNDLDYRPYEQKHYESIFTRFFQGYYLIEKFGFDKRRGHFSDLIRSKQLTRKQGLKQIKFDPYTDVNKKEEDIKYVMKKLELNKTDLKILINNKNKNYSNYKNSKDLIGRLKTYYNFFRMKGIFQK